MVVAVNLAEILSCSSLLLLLMEVLCVVLVAVHFLVAVRQIWLIRVLR